MIQRCVLKIQYASFFGGTGDFKHIRFTRFDSQMEILIPFTGQGASDRSYAVKFFSQIGHFGQ
jgi:hypothetical protein